MFSIRRPSAALSLAVIAALGAGCGTGATETSTTPSTSTTPAPADDPSADPPTHAGLVADPNDGSILCVRVANGGRVSLYDPTVLAHGNLTIVDATIAGKGVRLLGAEGVTSLAPVNKGPGALVDDEWPLTLSKTRPGTVDKDTRQPLVGTTVDDGTRILPLISLRVTRPGGAHASALVLTYRVQGGPATRTERVPLDLNLPAGKCR